MSKNKSFPIFLAFLAMGFGDAIGPFVGLAKQQFDLTNFEAQIIAFMGFIMFGVLSVPVGLFQDRKGKKVVLMMGLGLALVGLVIPLFGLSNYALFLLTILLLGAGASILQVAGNPIMRDVSPPGKYARNLTLGQFIKAIGSISGSLIPFAAAKWFGMDWIILFPIYSSFLVITLVIIGFTRIEERDLEHTSTANLKSCFSLLKHPFIAMMVLGIFLYVGAEVSVSSGVPILLSNKFGIDLATFGLLGNAFFFVAVIAGRFGGSIVLNWMDARKFFLMTSFLSIAGLLLMFTNSQPVVIAGIFIAGLGFANVFPLIFSITVDSMPDRSNEISGLMVTAIVGGAIIPPIMGLVADFSSVAIGFVVPLAAVVYICYLAIYVANFKPAKS
jgi:MFS transporter, FHS family, L-fucose permease